MANMRYCMMENTARDLSDVLDAIYEVGSLSEKMEELNSSYEKQGLKRIIEMAREIAEMWEEEQEDEL